MQEPSEPSVRGSIVRGVVEELLRQREGGAIPPERLAEELEPADLAILADKVLDGGWYPAASYSRLLELLCRSVGRGSRIFYAERGAVNAQRLMDAGLYAQLDLLERLPQEIEVTDDAPEHERLARMGRAFATKLEHIVSLAGSIYSMGRWSVVSDPDTGERLCIEIVEAEAYTDPMRLAIEGFLNQCVRTVPGREPLARLFRSERAATDLIRIRMTMDLRQVMAKV
ncbi:MAG: hypothetical protein R3263_12720 [Myxococcota bacterium]|nr:hypothetical protein [Myxococcota bacterium]